MPAGNLIDGRAIARLLQDELAERIKALDRRGIRPGLAFVRVGEDAASKVYVGRKEKACAELGIFSETKVLPESATEAELLALIHKLNAMIEASKRLKAQAIGCFMGLCRNITG